MNLSGTDLERTMNLLGLLNDPTIAEGAKGVIELLNDYPYYESKSTARVENGATIRQVAYIGSLSGIAGEGIDRLYIAFDFAGGLSSQQAHYLIQRLKELRARETY
jgi:hypothetical protein